MGREAIVDCGATSKASILGCHRKIEPEAPN